MIDVPADRLMKDVITISLPQNLSPVHFVRLDITDRGGKPVSQNFYWRSNKEYKGGHTLTGPQYQGFADINKLPVVDLQAKVAQSSRKSRNFYTVTLTNPSKNLAFMVWVRLQEAISGKPIRPAFYDDNFFSLLPGESRTIQVEYSGAIPADLTKLVIDGWNVSPKEFHKGHWKTLPQKERMAPAMQQAASGN